jgi:hypothetical protein
MPLTHKNFYGQTLQVHGFLCKYKLRELYLITESENKKSGLTHLRPHIKSWVPKVSNITLFIFSMRRH